MDKIVKSVEVPFYSISISDAIQLVELMDNLIQSITYDNMLDAYKKLDNRNGYSYPCAPSLYITNAKNIYYILKELGFVGSGMVDIQSDNFIFECRKK